MQLTAGQNISINRLSPESKIVDVSLVWEPRDTPLELDASAFCLTAAGKVRGDEDFVFYNNPRTQDGSVTRDNRGQVFSINLESIPSAIEKVAITVTIHEGQNRGQSFANLSKFTSHLRDGKSKELIASYDVATASLKETALIVAEVYRRNNEWKFRAIGQGFVGGLAPLATNFGITVAEPEPTTNAPPPQPAPPQPVASPPPQPVPPSPPAPPPRSSVPPTTAPSSVRLSKITLEKKGQAVSLEKKGGSFGEIIVNLNWSSQPTRSRGILDGIFGGKGPGIDLDLGCLFELKDGKASGIQALGNQFGRYDQLPYIQLMGDDRTGTVSAGETLRINGRYFDVFERILIYAFIYEGVPNWSHADGRVTVTIPGQPTLEVHLDNHRNDLPMCAIAMIENDQGNIRVTKLAEYYQSHMPMDRAYGFGLQWRAGSKD